MEDVANEALARRVLASLDDVPAAAVRLLAAALALTDGLIGRFAQPFDYYADVLEFPDVGGGLAEIALAYALQVVARDPGCDLLLERLEDAPAAPWPRLAAALRAVRDAERARAS